MTITLPAVRLAFFPPRLMSACCWMAAVSMAVTGPLHGELLVVGETISEGESPDGTTVARFTLTQSPIAATPTVWEYATSADTAREGTDYFGRRGMVTIPAGGTSATVDVPVIGDRNPEDAESFSLIVWPQGEAPQPELVPVTKPVSVPPFRWSEGINLPVIPVSAHRFLFDGLIVGQIESRWEVERSVTTPPDNSAHPTRWAWAGRHLLATDYHVPSVGLGPRQRVYQFAADGASRPLEGQLVQNELLPSEASVGDSVDIAVAGTTMAVSRARQVEFYQVFPSAAPRRLGRWEASGALLGGGLAFSGRRAVVPRGGSAFGGAIVIEATDDSLGIWTQRASLAGLGPPFALEGDTLVASRSKNSPQGSRSVLVVFERAASLPHNWVEVAELPLPDSSATPFFRNVALRGGLIVVGDPYQGIQAPYRPGRILVYARATTGSLWSLTGTIEAVTPEASDQFGASIGVAGRHLVVSAPSADGRELYSGLFLGAEATIVDDDIPSVMLNSGAQWEPVTGEAALIARLDLSHAAAGPVAIRWQTRSGTAVAGEDFRERQETLILPPGQVSAELSVPVLADARIEGEESFFIDIFVESGAVVSAVAGASVACRIGDSTPPAVVAAHGSEFYEGLPGSGFAVHLHPGADPMEVPWRTQAVTRSGTSLDSGAAGLGEVGIDLPDLSGTLSATVPVVHSLAVATMADSLTEITERATLAFSVPKGVTTATFGARFVAWPPVGHLDEFGPPTTDGEWVAAATYPSTGFVGGSAAGLVLWRRASAAAVAWVETQTLRPSAIGLNEFPAGRYLLRRGRLAYYAPGLGKAWIFRPSPISPGIWGLEVAFDTERTVAPNGPEPEFDFDGETLVAHARWNETALPQLSIHSWEHGRWWPRERIADEFGWPDMATRPSRAPAVAHDSIVFLASDNRIGPTIGSVRRRGPPGARWILEPPQALEGPPIDDAVSTLKRAGHLLALGQTYGDRPTTIYRLRADGTWQIEATLPDAPAYFQPGVLIGKSSIWRESREGGEPWRSIGPATLGQAWPSAQLPPGVATAGDLVDGVWVATRPVPAWNASPRVGGLLIAEAGADIAILDEDTFVYQLPLDVIGSEAIARENQGALVSVSAPTEVPLDVIIPYRTTSAGTATPGEDFRPVSGQLRMPAGQRQATLIIPILPDADLDTGESIEVEFGEPSFGRMAESRLTISIFDRPVALPPAELVSVFEPVAGTQFTDVPFRLAQAYRHPVTVSYQFAPRFATAADFNIAPGQLTIPPGQQIVPVPLTVLADSLVEGPESLSVTITVDGTQARATSDVIIDDAQNGGGSPDRYVVSGGGVLDFSPSRSVLANDNTALSMVQAAREPRHGRVDWRPDGTFNYEPNPNFIGIDRFGYQAGSAGESVLGDAEWKWLHPLDGRDPAQTIPNFHSVWMTPGFDDTTWSPGRGLMGYGALGPGQGQPLTTHIGAPTGARLTAYFRCHFNAPAFNPPGLTVRLACDDAVILYLNGQEVGRYAEPPDPAFLAAPDSYALVCLNVHDADEETAIRTLRLPTAQLVEGPNVLAISLHNQSPNSSDLGLWVVEGLSGIQTTPVEVAVEVVDGATPPVVLGDFHQLAKLSSTVDSRLWAGGSAYANDGLLRPDGQPYDPILEAETGGSPVAPVEFDPQTGHCRMELPPGFFGTTAFTYRVRDKDGWSEWAEVQWVIAPTRPFDVWRQDLFGGGSLNPVGHELADEDVDGLPNVVEFALALDPRASESAPRIDVQREGNPWVVEFMARSRFGEDVFIGLEQSRSMDDGGWSRLAWLNDVYPSTQQLSPGVEFTTEPAESGLIRYRIILPPSISPADFWRLRVSRESHPLDP